MQIARGKWYMACATLLGNHLGTDQVKSCRAPFIQQQRAWTSKLFLVYSSHATRDVRVQGNGHLLLLLEEARGTGCSSAHADSRRPNFPRISCKMGRETGTV